MHDRWEDWFQPGETLLWKGGPTRGFRHVLRNIFFTAFGIPFLGAGFFTSGLCLGYIFGFDGGWDAAPGILMVAFGIPFIAVGAGVVFGPWLDEYLKPSRVRYTLTDQNGYIASRLWKRNMEVLPIRRGTPIEVEEHRDGAQSVWFHFDHTRDSDGDRQTIKKGFEALADGHAVYRKIRNLQADLPAEPE